MKHDHGHLRMRARDRVKVRALWLLLIAAFFVVIWRGGAGSPDTAAAHSDRGGFATSEVTNSKSPRSAASATVWPTDCRRDLFSWPDNGTDNSSSAANVAAIEKAMAALLLQAVTYGDTPQAIISGELVREGDVVNGFLVLVIEPRAVQLERDGVRLKLNL